VRCGASDGRDPGRGYANGTSWSRSASAGSGRTTTTLPGLPSAAVLIFQLEGANAVTRVAPITGCPEALARC
jgi:hypothetical protein